MTDDEIRERAINFAKSNKQRIAKELTSPSRFPPHPVPISTFMAGSPGAGKTELSKHLIAHLEEDKGERVVRIDGDDLRVLIPGYAGSNSHLFQGGVSILVERLHDLVLRQRQDFMLDGTFSNYEKARHNVVRSLEKQRPVMVLYVYQEPEIAWKFTQAREAVEGRNIPKISFINQFLGARETVERLSSQFGDRIRVFLLKKDFEKNTVDQVVKITPEKPQFDELLPRRYTPEELEKIL